MAQDIGNSCQFYDLNPAMIYHLVWPVKDVIQIEMALHRIKVLISIRLCFFPCVFSSHIVSSWFNFNSILPHQIVSIDFKTNSPRSFHFHCADALKSHENPVSRIREDWRSSSHEGASRYLEFSNFVMVSLRQRSVYRPFEDRFVEEKQSLSVSFMVVSC